MTCEEFRSALDIDPEDCTIAFRAAVVAHLIKCRPCRLGLLAVCRARDAELGPLSDDVSKRYEEQGRNLSSDPEAEALLRQAAIDAGLLPRG